MPEGRAKRIIPLRPCTAQRSFTRRWTPVFLRPVLTKEEADDLIRSMPSIRAERVETGNLQLRSRQYQASFQSHDAADLVKLIKTIHWRDAAAPGERKAPREAGRKVPQACGGAALRRAVGSIGDLPGNRAPIYPGDAEGRKERGGQSGGGVLRMPPLFRALRPGDLPYRIAEQGEMRYNYIQMVAERRRDATI